MPWRALTAEIEAWDDLALNASEPNPFFESWYLLPSLTHLPNTQDVHILRFEHEGKLAGLLPILREKRYYRWPIPQISSWLHPNCFCGTPLIVKGLETQFWQAALRWADQSARTAMFIHLRHLVLDGPVHLALTQVASQQKRQAELVHQEARALLTSTLTPAAYLEASISSKKRKELRRQSNRLADQGVISFERRTDSQDIVQWCDTFLELECAGWKGTAGSALSCDTSTARLFCESLTGAASRGRLERLTLTLNDAPIAMLATFLAYPGAYSFKTAFAEEYARFSPGVLLQCENLQILDNPRHDWTDSCASADHPMIDHLWRERRTMGRISIAIGGGLRRSAFRHFVRAETSRNPVALV